MFEMRFTYQWYLKSGKFWKAYFTLAILLTAFTFIYVKGLNIVQSDHLRAGMTFQVDDPLMHPFYVFVPFGRLPYSPMVLMDNLMLDFLFPLILAFFFIDINFHLRKANLSSNVILLSGKKLIVSQFLMVLFASFLTLFLAFIYQITIARIADLVLKPLGEVETLHREDILLLMTSSSKIALYFASLCGLGYTIGLYLHRLFPLTYIMPMLINVTLVLVMPRNAPSRLGFIDTFMVFSRPESYPLIIILILLAAILLLTPHLWKRDLL